MTRGLPKKYAKMGFSDGWKAYKATQGKTNKGATTKRKVRTVRKVPKRRTTKRRTRRRKRTLPIAPLVGLGAGFVAPTAYGYSVLDGIREGNWDVTIKRLVRNYTGLDTDDSKFNFDIKSAYGLWYLVGGALAHKAAGWLGINRIFNNLPSPLDRLRI